MHVESSVKIAERRKKKKKWDLPSCPLENHVGILDHVKDFSFFQKFFLPTNL